MVEIIQINTIDFSLFVPWLFHVWYIVLIFSSAKQFLDNYLRHKPSRHLLTGKTQ